MKNIIFCFKLLIIFALCSFGLYAQPSELLVSETWHLVEINNQLVPLSKAHLNFSKVSKSISGNGGCNEIYGKYKVTGRSLKFRELITTKMFCTEDSLMNIESDFVNALKKVTRFVINNDELLLFAGSKSVLKLAKLKPAAEDPNLSGKKWLLKKIGYSDVPKTKEIAFIVFDKEKRTISGNTSCNTFGGKYVINGRRMMITEIISTKRACTEGETMRVEMQLLDGLEKTEWYSILNGRFTLSLGRFNLLTFEEQK